MARSQPKVSAGSAQPLGATLTGDGVNFSVYSEHASSIELLLFDSEEAAEPSRVLTLDPEINKSFHFWHIHVPGIRPGQLYAYRADGPSDTSASGLRFNRNKVLIDPYALGNVNNLWDRNSGLGTGDNVTTSMRSVVINPDDYDWEDDQPLNIPLADSVIYEMHVRGFTKSPTSGVANPGTFAGVAEQIPYLKGLGITAVELLPVYDFDEHQVLKNAPDGTPLRNYWGYDPYGHFAPQSSYCVDPTMGSHLREFRDMVKALHKAGIEVILDVVYNHTGEGNQNGPVISFRGFANEAYYHLVPQDKQYYMDYSGCGNTFNANHPVVTKYIIESLEYWVSEMHVDGFRFDLGSVLSRGPDGGPMSVPPVLWNIELSRVLSDTKVIAEAWDAGGLYQVGRFPGERWCEWNGPYRDKVRSFVKGDPGLVGDIATRLGGSADLFGTENELPTNSINFVTCHDGFTLYDLVSYNEKHNDANGEDNRDGNNDNASWNCGVEGPTDDPQIEALRRRQMKNFLVILLMSRGVPMLLGGDEFGRTQGGNNNAYCQDDPTSWFDWTAVERHADILRFTRGLIRLRRRLASLLAVPDETNLLDLLANASLRWSGVTLGEPDLAEWSRSVALTIQAGNGSIHLIFNAYWEPLEFELPALDPGLDGWRRIVDTSRDAPEDLATTFVEATVVETSRYRAESRSIAILAARPARGDRNPAAD